MEQSEDESEEYAGDESESGEEHEIELVEIPDDDDEEEPEAEEEVEVRVGTVSSRVSQEASTSGAAAIDERCSGIKRRRKDDEVEEEAMLLGGGDVGEGGKEREWNREEIDGLFCSICMEAWTNDGVHQVCCLPCGHLYGLACIQRWIRDQRSAAKCPQCNKKCTLNGIRKLYASQIVAIDDESKKRIEFLEKKCASLETKGDSLAKKEADWRKKETEYQIQLHQATQKANYFESLVNIKLRGQSEMGHPGFSCKEKAVCGRLLGQESFHFTLQKELQVLGGQMIDIDTSNLLVLVARKDHGVGGMHLLTKVSLLHPHDTEHIMLPPCTKAVKDLHISTFDQRLVLLASLGKKLSIFSYRVSCSLETNNATLSYDLPTPPWSCSWDINNSHHLYAGLQNGMLLMFDIRKSSGPVQSIKGLTCNPIHTVHSLPHLKGLPSGVNSVFAASSVGLSLWNLGDSDGRPYLIPDSDNQGVCISLAYCHESDEAVASFRPKVGSSSEVSMTQPVLSPFRGIGQPVAGSHILYKSFGSNQFQKLESAVANVNSIRLPKSVIMELGSERRVFASGDELNNELVLQKLPSFEVSQRLKYPSHPMRDIKFAHGGNQGLLGCLSEDTLQLFSC